MLSEPWQQHKGNPHAEESDGRRGPLPGESLRQGDYCAPGRHERTERLEGQGDHALRRHEHGHWAAHHLPQRGQVPESSKLTWTQKKLPTITLVNPADWTVNLLKSPADY